jgi:hypothetical protein
VRKSKSFVTRKRIIILDMIILCKLMTYIIRSNRFSDDALVAGEEIGIAYGKNKEVVARLVPEATTKQLRGNGKSHEHNGRSLFRSPYERRRDYYREEYLKSDAWNRKRYVVLRRDNWRCVYCGAPATQVHHKRYAKKNIGKEPIEWLVSICKPCHDSIHHK